MRGQRLTVALVSNLERALPEEIELTHGATGLPQMLIPREVPLGGPRAMLVRRTLPHRDRRMIGAWCFVDHYGPVDLSRTEGMRVPPHPHTGLQTVSWLIDGAILHADSIGSHVEVRPGQLNLMTAGRGISHAEDSHAKDSHVEESLAQPSILHGIQLWVALPAHQRHQAPHFEHHGTLPMLRTQDTEVVVFMGDLLGMSSPALTYTPIVGAQLRLTAGASISIPVHADYEYGVLAVQGSPAVDGIPLSEHALLDLGAGHELLTITTTEDSLLLLLGGEPFAEKIVMWWNFIGRDHEEIATMRSQWQDHDPLFGTVRHNAPRLEPPELPNTRLKARGARR